MKQVFYKYQGTGNDFIIIDNRSMSFPKHNTNLIHNLCDRHLGIGADGLIILENHDLYDFSMLYYNADGYQSSMCGNGGRCIAAFAYNILPKKKTNLCFLACDGEHIAIINDNTNNISNISLKMNNVNKIKKIGNDYFLNTGSPHYVKIVNNLAEYKVVEEGKMIRNNKNISMQGTNVDFVEFKDKYIYVRTYERGVEDETLSCGTGVIASAIINNILNPNNNSEIEAHTNGGILKVNFETSNKETYSNIWLTGNVSFVFKGDIDI